MKCEDFRPKGKNIVMRQKTKHTTHNCARVYGKAEDIHDKIQHYWRYSSTDLGFSDIENESDMQLFPYWFCLYLKIQISKHFHFKLISEM